MVMSPHPTQQDDALPPRALLVRSLLYLAVAFSCLLPERRLAVTMSRFEQMILLEFLQEFG